METFISKERGYISNINNYIIINEFGYKQLMYLIILYI